jgi:hypothetical protein
MYGSDLAVREVFGVSGAYTALIRFADNDVAYNSLNQDGNSATYTGTHFRSNKTRHSRIRQRQTTANKLEQN